MPSFTTAFFLETVALCWMNGDKREDKSLAFATAQSRPFAPRFLSPRDD